jgi:DNA-binding FadR family transcriptional regulator
MLRNGLKAGDLLPTEQAMSEMLGVSRNVLREAIKSMELMGMVSACPGKGTVIKGVQPGLCVPERPL